MDVRELSAGHLSADSYRLVRLMRLLGPSVLRLTEHSLDPTWWTSHNEPRPSWATSTITPADLSAIRRLLTLTGWRLLLGLDLGHFEPARAADEAHYAREILGIDLMGVEIGNEPDEYSAKSENLRPSTYNVSDYLSEAEVYRQALMQSTPGLAIYGPDLSNTGWLTLLGEKADNYTEITQHYYPTSACPGTPPSIPPATAAGLLSPAVRQGENQTLRVLAQARLIAGRPTRIGETNDVSCGGSLSASPVFASALWSLDWTLRAVSSGVSALNFNGELGVCYRGSYSPVCSSTHGVRYANNVRAQPEYYGLLAARQLEGGRFVPTSLTRRNPLPNITTWATIAPDGTIKIAIDNLAISGLVQPVSISIAGYTATAEQLASPSITTSSGITFGATQVTGDGLWRPRIVGLTDTHSSFQVLVRPSSAVIVTLRRKHSSG